MGAITRYLIVGLVVALILAGWRLDHVTTSLGAAKKLNGELEAAAESRKNTQRLLLQLDTQHTEERERANQINAVRLARINTGAERLSVKASCPAVRDATAATSVDHAEARAELDPASAGRIVATATDGDDAIRALSALQDYVSTACLPRK
ncbi:UNVERIFIED_ORG: prophage endopeptidase [Pseudomonas lini]